MLRIVAGVVFSCVAVWAQGPVEKAETKQPAATPPAAEATRPQEPAKPQQDPKPSLVPEGAAGLDAMQLARAMTSTMKLSKPGPEHDRLMALEGTYAVEMTLTPPELPPLATTGEARAMSVLSGRYLLVNLKVRVAGVVMEGLYILGYDNLRSLYTVSWRDSLSTWAVECAGPVSDASPDVAALQGTMVDAASPTGRPFELVLGFTKEGFALAVRDKVKGELAEVMRQNFVRKPKQEGEAQPAEPKSGESPRDK